MWVDEHDIDDELIHKYDAVSPRPEHLRGSSTPQETLAAPHGLAESSINGYLRVHLRQELVQLRKLDNLRDSDNVDDYLRRTTHHADRHPRETTGKVVENLRKTMHKPQIPPKPDGLRRSQRLKA